MPILERWRSFSTMPDLHPSAVLAAYPVHDRTIPGLYDSRQSVGRDRAFLVHEGRCWSWREFGERVGQVARGLVKAGVRHGDRIAVMARNSDRLIVTFLAVQRVGAIYVPLNPDFGLPETTYIFRHAGVTGVVASDEALGTATTAARELCAWVRNIDEPWPESADLPPPPQADDCSVIVYTSGTTGFPKGVVHTHRNFVTIAEGFVGRMNLQPSDRLLIVLPLSHVNALFYSLGGAIAAGASVSVVERFSASRFWRTVAETQATEVNIVAAMGSMLASRPIGEFAPGHRLRKLYGAPLPGNVVEAFHRRFNVPIVIEGYGMSEIPGVASQPMGEPPRIGSFGKPCAHPNPAVPATEMLVMDDCGHPVGDDVVGELWVRTPTIMREYYRAPALTAAAIQDGWFLTGDLVRRDSDGWFWFVGRRKDIIRRRGENISGAELDRIVGEHPAVAEAAAIGVPSPLGEEDILLAIVPKAGHELVIAEIVEWCRDRLPAFKWPAYISVVDDLPKTPTHRVAKYRLRQDAGLIGSAVNVEQTLPRS